MANPKNVYEEYIDIGALLASEDLNPEALAGIAEKLVKRDCLDDACAVYIQLAEIDPASFEACNNLCFLLTLLGRTDDAIFYGHRATGLDPDSALAHHNLGFAYSRAGQFPAALQALHAAADRDPDNEKILTSLASCYANIGEQEAALHFFEQSFAAGKTLYAASQIVFYKRQRADWQGLDDYASYIHSACARGEAFSDSFALMLLNIDNARFLEAQRKITALWTGHIVPVKEPGV